MAYARAALLALTLLAVLFHRRVAILIADSVKKIAVRYPARHSALACHPSSAGVARDLGGIVGINDPASKKLEIPDELVQARKTDIARDGAIVVGLPVVSRVCLVSARPH